MPLATSASAISLMSFSFCGSSPNMFQGYQPMGGVRASPSASAWAPCGRPAGRRICGHDAAAVRPASKTAMTARKTRISTGDRNPGILFMDTASPPSSVPSRGPIDSGHDLN